MKNAQLLVLLLVLFAPASFLHAQTKAASAVPPGPVTTDAEAIAALNLDAPGMGKVKAAVASGNQKAIEQAFLDYRRTSNPAKWMVMPSDQPAVATATDDPAADKICDHILPGNKSFHVDDFNMGKDFDWTANPVAKGDPSFSDEWTYGPVGRTPFWQKLADAYWKTRNEKYAAAWVDQLADFAVKCPLNYDGKMGRPQLWRTLDSAIRVEGSWPYSYNHFLNSPSFTPEANWLYLKLILDHASLLVGFLKTHPEATGNWVSTECNGVYSMGTCFPELKDAASWRDFAITRMTSELARMVPPDGFEIELTPGYDTVCISGFKGPVEVAKLNNATVPPIFKDKLMSMYRALVTVMDQSGTVTATNDSGRLSAVKIAKDGLKLADDPLLQWAASGGKSGQGLPDSTMLPYAGFYAMRSGWNPDDFFLFFRAGPPGSGHEHQDMLQVVLRAWNTTLLLNQGSYMYDHSDWRCFDINTGGYSTIIVDGKYQHRPTNKPPVDQPTNNPWVTTPLFDFVAGTYDGGYQTNVYNPKAEYHPESWVGELDRSVTHTRRIVYLRPYYALLLDTVDGTGHHTFDAHFNLDAPVAHIDKTTQAAFSDNAGDVQLGLYPLEKENLAVDIVQGQKDPMLGWLAEKHQPIPLVRFRKVQDAPAIFATLLYPYKGTAAPAFNGAALNVTGKGAWGQTMTTAQEKADVVVVKDGTSQSVSFSSSLVGKVSANASGLVIRQPTGKPAAFIGGWGMTSYGDGKTQFTLNAPANLVVAGQGNDVLIYNSSDKAVTLSMAKPFAQKGSLPPGAWTDLSAAGSKPGVAPTLFGTLEGAP